MSSTVESRRFCASSDSGSMPSSVSLHAASWSHIEVIPDLYSSIAFTCSPAPHPERSSSVKTKIREAADLIILLTISQYPDLCLYLSRSIAKHHRPVIHAALKRHGKDDRIWLFIPEGWKLSQEENDKEGHDAADEQREAGYHKSGAGCAAAERPRTFGADFAGAEEDRGVAEGGCGSRLVYRGYSFVLRGYSSSQSVGCDA